MRGAINGVVVLLGLALGAGCNQTMATADMGSGTDGGTDVDSGGGDTDASTCAHTVPHSPFGTRVGAKFSPITLPRCDSGAGTDYEFYNQDFCTNELTVFMLAAGWCYPCNLESDQMEAMLIHPYGPRGVRVVQVLTQDDDHNVPTTAFCTTFMNRQNGWPRSSGYYTPPDNAAAHVLSPDDHITVIDPTGLTQIYNPGASIPATLIVDGDGVIQYRYNGTGIDPTEGTADMTDLTACLDKLLSTPRQLCH